MLLNLKKISQEEYEAIATRGVDRTDKRNKELLGSDRPREMFVLRGTSFADGSPYIALRSGYPKTQRVLDTMERHGGKLLSETGFDCKLLAFKAAGPFRLKVCGRLMFEAADAGCYAVELSDPKDPCDLVSRADTFDFRANRDAGAGTVEVEFTALALVELADIVPERETAH